MCKKKRSPCCADTEGLLTRYVFNVAEQIFCILIQIEVVLFDANQLKTA